MTMKINDPTLRPTRPSTKTAQAGTAQSGKTTSTTSRQATPLPNLNHFDKVSSLPSRPSPKKADRALVKNDALKIADTNVMLSIDMLINMMFELSLTLRQSQRESRMKDASVAEEMGMAAADDIKNEAIMGIVGTTLSATAQVAGSATVMGGGIKTARSTNVMEVSNKMMTFQATSQSFGSLGQVTKGGFDYQAKEDEAEKTLHDSAATQAKSIEDSDSEIGRDAAQVAQSLLELIQKEEDSRHEAVRDTI